MKEKSRLTISFEILKNPHIVMCENKWFCFSVKNR